MTDPRPVRLEAGALAPATSTTLQLAARPLAPSAQPARAYLEQLSAGSRRTMRTALASLVHEVVPPCADPLAHCRCIEAFPWHRLQPAHTAIMRRRLADRLAPATVNKAIAAMRGVLREAWRAGAMDSESYHRAADVKTVPGSRLPSGRHLSAGEIRALFHVCAVDTSAAGPRDATALALMYGSGLRRSEVTALDLDNLDPTSCALRVLRAKGQKDRMAYTPPGTQTAITAWLAIRGDDAGPLLHPLRAGTDVLRRRMTDQALLYLCRRRAEQAQISPFSPHDLRRTWVGDLLDAGVDLSIVRQLAGHANIATTAKYDLRPERQKRQASDTLIVPYAPS